MLPAKAFLKSGLIFSLFISLICSCKKGDDNKPASTPNFSITGLRDVDFRTISSNSFTFPISVVANPGVADTVFLYANELPPGMYVDFTPISGATPFTSNVRVAYYGTESGTFTIHINGAGRSGLRTYDLKVTQPEFKGWRLAGEYYHNTTVEKIPGTTTINPMIRVNAMGGSQLVFTFALGAGLPLTTRTYTIVQSPLASNQMSITLHAPGHDWESTGNGSNTGSFVIDTAGKFTFNCTNVEMADSNRKEMLTASFGE
jgi:hypothetical protein